MVRVDPFYVNNLVNSLDQTTLSEQQLSTELSSGVRVTTLSDSPVAAGQNSLLNNEISQDDTFVQTASSEQSMLQVSDSALGSVVSQLTQAISLATEGNNGTLNASDTAAIAQQLSGIRDEVLSIANTSYLGKYVFSGSQGGTPPFTLNTGTSPATVSYHGDSKVQYLTSPTGQQIQLNVPGDQIFSAAGADVLGTLNKLIADFSSGTVSSTSISDATALKTGLDNVSQQRVTIDNSISRLQSSSSYAQTEKTQLQAAQNTLVAADTAQVATQLSTVETQHSALLNVISTLEKGSLFDYTH
ncbi:MAG: flagellar hook-associated protein FlgL [Acidobacteriaceae bacterium]